MSEPIKTKTCNTCKQTKPLAEFFKQPHNKDGYKNRCKICYSSYGKEYRQTEQGKIAQERYRQSEKGKATNLNLGRKHRYRQSEKGKATAARYEQSQKCKAARKLYRTQHPEKRKATHKCYIARHPGQLKAKNAVAYAVRVGKLPPVNTLQCHYCPTQAEHYHHHKGYEPKFWLDVIPVCNKCHGKTRSFLTAPRVLQSPSNGLLPS